MKKETKKKMELKFSKKGLMKMAEFEEKYLDTGVLAAGGRLRLTKDKKKKKKNETSK